MADTSHGGAGQLPSFITAPGETDTLFVIVVVAVILVILMLGVLYLKLHALPEQMAHASGHSQFQLVAVLALIALFTHNNLFWILALLLASIKLPDYEGQLRSISESLETMAGRQADETVEKVAEAAVPATDVPAKSEA